MIFQTFRFIREDTPGPKWQALFETFWPSYKEWFLSEGHLARAGYMTCAKKLGQHMPELQVIYEKLSELSGGGDLEARFLSLYCPPPYLAGCSQAVWLRGKPFLVRNYDYHPKLFEGTILFSNWTRPVIAVIDSLWGVLDGLNDAGLSVSLTFGGRKVVGDGFGVPVILRYILETCEESKAAAEILSRVPTHMPYNVSVLDRNGQFFTAFLAPDRATVITDSPVGTNHQQAVEWADYERVTSSVARKKFLEESLSDKHESEQKFIKRFLKPPLYNTQYAKAFGTLYTTVYRPASREVLFYWPNHSIKQSFSDFVEKEITVNLRQTHTAIKG